SLIAPPEEFEELRTQFYGSNVSSTHRQILAPSARSAQQQNREAVRVKQEQRLRVAVKTGTKPTKRHHSPALSTPSPPPKVKRQRHRRCSSSSSPHCRNPRRRGSSSSLPSPRTWFHNVKPKHAPASKIKQEPTDCSLLTTGSHHRQSSNSSNNTILSLGICTGYPAGFLAAPYPATPPGYPV
ncbi:hypothetical protein V5O48_019376, partial [Marasmius crinis-equi]